MALSPDDKFIYVNPDGTVGEYNNAQYFPVKYLRGLECIGAAQFYIYFRGPKDASSTRITVSIVSGSIKEFFTQFVDEVNFGEASVITLADRNIAVDATTGGTDFVHVNAFVAAAILSDVTSSGYEDVQVAEDLDIGGSLRLDNVVLSEVQKSTESFVDNDTSLMTSGAIEDKILSYGYSTTSGDITAVTITTDSGGGSTASETSGSADFSIVGTQGVNVTNTGADATVITVSGVAGEIDHDSLQNFVANEHLRWDNDVSSTATIHANNITDLHGAGVDGSANQILTDDGDGTVTSESDVTYDSGAFSITSATDNKPIVTLSCGGTAQVGAQLTFKRTATGADNTDIGTINFEGKNEADEDITYAKINVDTADASDGAEEGQMLLSVASHDGELQPGLNIISGNLEDEVDATIGNGSASVVTIPGFVSIGGHAVNDIDVAGEFVDSDEHLMTAAAINDQFGGGGGVTADPFSTTVIKILPHQFMINDDAGRPAMIEDDTSNTLGVRCAGTTDEMYAFQKIPTGYKVTHVRVNASASTSSAVSVRSYNYQTGADNAVSATTGDLNANIDITDIPSSATQDLVIKVSPASASTIVYGALVTIATI